MLAIANGRPETLSLSAAIEQFLDFQFEIYTRKYQTLLRKELEKSEIQEGLMRAVDIIDLIIEILRGSKNVKQARACLTSGITEGIRFKTKKSERDASKLNFTEAQATAILEMRLYRLIGLELTALIEEHEKTLKNIAEYQDILENHSSMSRVIVRELDQIKKNYARPRRTTIENAAAIVYEEKKPEAMEVVLLIDRFGYARTIDTATFERNREAALAENRYIINCMNDGRVCIFTDAGRLHFAKMADIPFGRFRDKAVPLDNFTGYDSTQENIIHICSLDSILQSKLVFVTESGLVKTVAGSEFNASKRTIAATKLGEDDKLLSVFDVNSYNQLVLQSEKGLFIRFALSDITEMKKTAAGVRGIGLSVSDKLVAAWPLNSSVPFSIRYKEKELLLNRIKLTGRGGKGTKVRV